LFLLHPLLFIIPEAILNNLPWCELAQALKPYVPGKWWPFWTPSWISERIAEGTSRYFSMLLTMPIFLKQS